MEENHHLEEAKNRSLLAPCGLYCGVCGVYIATRDKNDKFVEILAKQGGTEPMDVVLLRVCEPQVSPAYYAPEFSETPLNWGKYMQQETDRCKQTAAEYLAEIEKRLKDLGIGARSELLVGKADEEIVDYANKDPFNLIVMATHGRTGLSRWVYGSKTENVLLGVSTPIFLVRPS